MKERFSQPAPRAEIRVPEYPDAHACATGILISRSGGQSRRARRAAEVEFKKGLFGPCRYDRTVAVTLDIDKIGYVACGYAQSERVTLDCCTSEKLRVRPDGRHRGELIDRDSGRRITADDGHECDRRVVGTICRQPPAIAKFYVAIALGWHWTLVPNGGTLRRLGKKNTKMR